MMEVTAAVIWQGDKFLICQRPREKYCGLLWEFPGGKIEPGETPQEALAREIREELDTVVSVGDKLAQVEYDYPEFHLSMGCYDCVPVSGKLTLLEHEAAKWLAPEELGSVNWLPADLEFIEKLRTGGDAVR